VPRAVVPRDRSGVVRAMHDRLPAVLHGRRQGSAQGVQECRDVQGSGVTVSGSGFRV